MQPRGGGMRVSHRLRFEIACPSCGVAGIIRVIEDAGPPFDDVPRRDYRGDPGTFEITSGATPSVQCLACGAEFPLPI
jgi:hypothetical protein